MCRRVLSGTFRPDWRRRAWVERAQRRVRFFGAQPRRAPAPIRWQSDSVLRVQRAQRHLLRPVCGAAGWRLDVRAGAAARPSGTLAVRQRADQCCDDVADRALCGDTIRELASTRVSVSYTHLRAHETPE